MDQNVFTALLLSGVFALSSPVPRKYIYVNQSMTWLEAQSTCREKFIDLATVYNAIDMNRLMQANANDSNEVWIGLKKGWLWTSGEDLSNYSHWLSSQPNEGNLFAACGLLTNEGWHDYYCNSTFYFVCYDDTASSSVRFKFITLKMNWIDAQIYCKQKYTDLANIRSAEEENQVLSLVNGNFVWIGLISGQWSDAAFNIFRYWEQKQREGTLTKGCVTTVMDYSGMWNLSSCTLKKPFICYGGLQPQNRTYHFVKYRKTWSQAQSYCRERNSDLAIVDSTNNMVDMKNAVDPGYNGSLWIGLNRTAQSIWVWSEGDDQLLNFSNWDAGRPNGSGNCAVSIHSVWRDYDCMTPLYFVCFKSGIGYIVVNITKSWKDAQSYCRANYTDLATINSPWHQKLLTDLVGNGVYVWVGLFLDNWQWSDQWNLFFRNWAVGQPNMGAGNCATMVTSDLGKWTVDDCSVQYPFICYGGESVNSHVDSS